jgi:hypothetical protein
MSFIKAVFLKIYYNLIIFSQKEVAAAERVEAFYNSAKYVSPVGFVLGLLNTWYMENTEFTYAVLIIVFINMFLGGIMHFRKGAFRWEVLLTKTMIMLIVIGVSYSVLEMIVSFSGSGIIIQGFRASIQVATLLYPGAKILKHIFVLSNGEYPPKWLMDKLYKFKENGDLNQFLDTENNETK